MGAKKKSATQKPGTKKAQPKSRSTMGAPRKDFGAPVDAYFAEQPPEKRALLDKLRALVDKEVPDATATIKWGVPVYQVNGRNVCSLAAFKEHVGINFFASPDVLIDPDKKLEGSGKSMRMLKVRSAKDIDTGSTRRWLKAAVAANS
jgi:hypothetical protein